MRSVLSRQRYSIRRSQPGINRALRRVVRHAYGSIAHYKRRFDEAGVDDSSISSVEDLHRLPITWRTDLSSLHATECTDPSANLDRCLRHSTSGSSGTPLHIYMRPAEQIYRRVILGRVLWRGLKLFPPLRIVEFGRVLKPNARETTGIPGFLTIVKPPGLAHPSEQYTRLERFRPQIIEGFPTALEDLALFCLKEHKRPPQPRLVVSRGEILFPEVRQLLGTVFNAPVVDHYNCEEVGNVAWQCPLDPQRMHISQDACIVEVVNDQGDPLPRGEVGLLALTNLYNYTMPFIRYVLGDRGRLLPDAPSPCACGSRNPSMALLEGRADDWIYLPSGRRISPRVVATVLFRRPDGSRVAGIHRYQLIQESTAEIMVRVVLGTPHDSDWAETLSATAQRELGGMRLAIQQVEHIPFEHSGKFKRVVSRICPR